MPRPRQSRTPLTVDEREGIILAVSSAFRKLKNLYTKIVPIFEGYGFTPPSAGVIAQDLSEKIEKAIIQHCETFAKGTGHCDLCRFGQDWEVKICKDSGLTINQSKVINGENYIVVNYKANSIRQSDPGFCGPLRIGFSLRRAQELERSQHQSSGRRREHRGDLRFTPRTPHVGVRYRDGVEDNFRPGQSKYCSCI